MSHSQIIDIQSTQDIEFIDITAQVRDFVRAAKCGPRASC